MANTIKLKRGTSTPSTSDIDSGEVAIDTSAQKLYINDSGTVKEIGGGGSSIGGNTGVDFNDNVKARWGTGNDLEIYHSGSDTFIHENTKTLILKTTAANQGTFLQSDDTVWVTTPAAGETMAKFIKDGAVELYYDNSKKFETNAYGTITTGHSYLFDNYKLQLGSSQDLQIYHDGTDNYWETSSGTTHFRVASGNRITINGSSGDVTMQGSSGKNFLWDNSTAYLNLNDNARATYGTSNDLQIFHDGSNSKIENATGELRLQNSTWIKYQSDSGHIFYNASASETLARFNNNGAVELYYDNQKQFETISTGVRVPDSKGYYCGDGNDLRMFFNGTDGYIRAEAGKLNLDSSGGEKFFIGNPNGAVELYYDNSKTFQTTSYGAEVIGTFRCDALSLLDNEKIQLGSSGSDLEIYHSGTNTFFENTTGNVYFRNDGSATYFQMGSGNETGIAIAKDDGVFLYFNDAQKFQTTNTGVSISTNAAFPDNGKAIFGASDDLQIYHDGTNNYIKSANDNQDILIQSSRDLYLATGDGSTGIHTFLYAADNAGVELRYDNSKKFETDANGVTITGQCALTSHAAWPDHSSGYVGKAVFGNGDDLQIYHDGSHSYIKDSGTGNLRIDGSDNVELQAGGSTKAYTYANGLFVYNQQIPDNGELNIGNGSDLKLYHNAQHSFIKNSTGNLYIWSGDGHDGNIVIQATYGEESIWAKHNGAVELYYDNSKKFETLAVGVRVASGNLYMYDSGEIICGTGGDLKIYHDASDSWIKNTTGVLVFASADIQLANVAGSEQYIRAVENGSVQLYYDNVKKAQTYANGLEVIGNLYMQTGGQYLSDNVKIHIGNSNDLQIYHDGTDNIILSSGASCDLLTYVANGELAVKAIANGAVEIYHNNNKKLETTSSGVTVTGALTSDNTCKAYINLNQGNNNIRLAYNVASITDNGTGQHRITFTTALSNAYYSVTTGGSRDQPESSRCFPTNVDNINTTYFDITNHNDGSTNVDWELCCCIVHGL